MRIEINYTAGITDPRTKSPLYYEEGVRGIERGNVNTKGAYDDDDEREREKRKNGWTN